MIYGIVKLLKKSESRWNRSLYINDLPSSTKYFEFRLFADDSNLFHTFDKRQKEIDMNEVNVKFLEVQKWCFVNKLTINLKKTNYMLIKGQSNHVKLGVF